MEWGVVFGIFGMVVGISGLIYTWTSRARDSKKDVKTDTGIIVSIQKDIEYIKSGIDKMQAENREYRQEQTACTKETNGRVERLERDVGNHEQRIAALEQLRRV